MTVFGTTVLVSGKDELLASRAVEARRDAALAEQPGADVNRIHATELAETMLSEVVGGSLFSSHIVAIIDEVGAAPSEVVDALVSLARDPGEDLCLILLHEGGVKGRKLIDALKKAKVPTESVEPLRPSEVPDFCRQEARRLRIRMSSDAPQALIEAIGHDLRSLSSAIRQLADDADNDEIDAALVRRYFAGRAEVTAFKVTDLVLAGNAGQAAENLRWALHTGVAHVLVTSAMANGFRAMGKYLSAQGARMRDADLARELGVPPWKIKDYSRWSRGWQAAEVAEAIKLIARADADIKGAAVDQDYALERMLLAVLAQRRG